MSPGQVNPIYAYSSSNMEFKTPLRLIININKISILKQH